MGGEAQRLRLNGVFDDARSFQRHEQPSPKLPLQMKRVVSNEVTKPVYYIDTPVEIRFPVLPWNGGGDGGTPVVPRRKGSGGDRPTARVDGVDGLPGPSSQGAAARCPPTQGNANIRRKDHAAKHL